MANIALIALKNFISMKSNLNTVSKNIYDHLSNQLYITSIETIQYFKENNISDLITPTDLYTNTPHRQVCEYLISSYWNELDEKIYSADYYQESQTWKFDLLENENNALLSNNKLIPTGKTSTIWVDGACNLNSGGKGWGSVVDDNGYDLLNLKENESVLHNITTQIQNLPVGSRRIIITHYNDVSTQQNNGAELLAMLVGLRIAYHDHSITTIKSDSQLIVDYWSLGKIASATKSKMDPNKISSIMECTRLRQSFNFRGGKIVKISGNINKADLGYHKNINCIK
jgi:ribonuclease HI